jgi:hypothetical protein
VLATTTYHGKCRIDLCLSHTLLKAALAFSTYLDPRPQMPCFSRSSRKDYAIGANARASMKQLVIIPAAFNLCVFLSILLTHFPPGRGHGLDHRVARQIPMCCSARWLHSLPSTLNRRKNGVERIRRRTTSLPLEFNSYYLS